MEAHFNLIEEAWIPCLAADGKFSMRSLRDALLSAHEIREIHAELPPMTASLLMLLLAVLYRSLRIETEEDWQAQWDAGRFDAQKIDAYLNAWRTRFDLFDREHPFYQDVRIGKREKDMKNLAGGPIKPKSVNDLILHSSSGDAATLFDHSTDDRPPPFPLALTARQLTMIQGFSLGGMASASIPADKYYKDSPHCRGVVFFLKGKNLFETLLLNLIANENIDAQFGKGESDIPAWEMDDAFADERSVPLGVLDFLTWQSRRIHLQPEKEGEEWVVRELFSAPGLGLSEEMVNPFFNITMDTKSGKQVKRPLRFSEGKALWRDSSAVLEPVTDSRRPPAARNWIGVLQLFGALDYQINFLACGLCSEPGQKKAYFYREENFSYPSAYLHSDSLRSSLDNMLKMGIDVKSQLWGVLNKMACLILSPESDQSEGRKPDPKDVQNLITHWDTDAAYWKALEIPYYDLVAKLPHEPGKAQEDWKVALRKSALKAYDQAVVMSGDSVAAMKASIRARRMLFGGINKVFGKKE